MPAYAPAVPRPPTSYPMHTLSQPLKKKVLLLQELTSRYLEQVSSGTTLTLAAFRPATKSGAAEIERITKVILGTALTALGLAF